MTRRMKWTLAIAAGLPVAGGLVLFLAAKRYASRFEPYIRDQAVSYLRERFRADVGVRELRIDLPALSPVDLYFSGGRGVMAAVTGRGILLQQGGRPLLKMDALRFEVDVGQAFEESHKSVRVVYLDGVDIIVPPKGSRPKLPPPAPPQPGGSPTTPASAVRIGEILISNARLIIQPRDVSRQPLEFELHRVRLTDAGIDAPLRYEAQLRNAKPPGEINSTGTFGPWDADEPGETPLAGEYRFERANLAVFRAIGGVLNSTGKFEGRLNHIDAKGSATVPDFHLKHAGNKMPLATRFEVTVDGTNGDTILKPVHGSLRQTKFVTSGGVIKHDGDQRRTIDLTVDMADGRLEDLLLLAMKGTDPLLSGRLQLKSRIGIPPLSGKVIEKLRLNGRFAIREGKFHRSQIQDRLDKMSRQAQGDPTNQSIADVTTEMQGRFELANELITFSELAFGIPGADLNLKGMYNIESEVLDFHGDLRLQAKLSQTQTGWKRWALKPVDPFFAKKGAGLYTRIKITGTRSQPSFGRE